MNRRPAGFVSALAIAALLAFGGASPAHAAPATLKVADAVASTVPTADGSTSTYTFQWSVPGGSASGQQFTHTGVPFLGVGETTTLADASGRNVATAVWTGDEVTVTLLVAAPDGLGGSMTLTSTATDAVAGEPRAWHTPTPVVCSNGDVDAPADCWYTNGNSFTSGLQTEGRLLVAERAGMEVPYRVMQEAQMPVNWPEPGSAVTGPILVEFIPQTSVTLDCSEPPLAYEYGWDGFSYLGSPGSILNLTMSVTDYSCTSALLSFTVPGGIPADKSFTFFVWSTAENVASAGTFRWSNTPATDGTPASTTRTVTGDAIRQLAATGTDLTSGVAALAMVALGALTVTVAVARKRKLA